LDDSKLKKILEAMLFVSPTPLSVPRLAKLIPEAERAEINKALESLTEDYAEKGVELARIAGGYRFFSREEYSEWAVKVVPAETEPKLSRAALETLSIIAYRQPITRVEIEEIRGISSTGVIRTLLERVLIEVKGRKDVIGRPKLYGTTRAFLDYFGLSDLKELPDVEKPERGL
jgi:segregation and condensation protein B